MDEYPYGFEGDDSHPFEEIDFLQDYILELDKPGSRAIVLYLEAFEKVLQPVINFVVEKPPADIVSDIALHRMTLRYLVKHLDWITRRAEFAANMLAETVAHYDLSEEAIAPVLEPEFQKIWRENRKRIGQREARERHLDEIVLARIAATKHSKTTASPQPKKRSRRKALKA